METSGLSVPSTWVKAEILGNREFLQHGRQKKRRVFPVFQLYLFHHDLIVCIKSILCFFSIGISKSIIVCVTKNMPYFVFILSFPKCCCWFEFVQGKLCSARLASVRSRGLIQPSQSCFFFYIKDGIPVDRYSLHTFSISISDHHRLTQKKQ